ncbi:MAG: hypothetical protein K2Y29_20425 [Beijerinckiaceae bacterium]|nr:hypothetical protein [Beijerinckiaceae bacterium]
MNAARNDESGWFRTLPFPRRWLWYIAIKVVVLALALYVTLKFYGLV